jgi:hypothetical protein
VALTAHTPTITTAMVIANHPTQSTFIIIIIRVTIPSCYTREGESKEIYAHSRGKPLVIGEVHAYVAG